MKPRKKLISAALGVSMLLVATGCSPNQSQIFQASMNLGNANSLQEHTTLTFQADGSGFSPSDQQQVDRVLAVLNNAKLDLDVKSNSNEQKTASTAEMEMKLALQGMNIDVPVWVNSNMEGKTPEVTEIVKVPTLAAASLPSQFASKEYMVFKPFDKAAENIDATAFMNLNKNLQAATMQFLTAYAQQFNPDIDVIDQGVKDIETSKGTVPARIYEIKLNDAQFKKLIRYAVNNFVQNADAMNYVKELMDSSLQFSQTPDKDEIISQFDQAFAQFKANRSAFLSQFNTVMDKLQNVTILGDKGIDIQYDISSGYVVKESGTVDLKLDLAQLSQFMNTLPPTLNAQGQQTSEQKDAVQSSTAKGTLNLAINFATDVSDINSLPVIEMPQVDSSNSFDYQDLVNSLNANTKVKSSVK
ncbi:hypothetical protein DEAC_c09200 [Desulfosporosinus acididurans]|uniref:Lipoprotein n=1 Tax=Desulfosporosinus acididurans TaxID=476652 RepID=A0A0J1IQN3_9FIRM|nr:hypothetical protein [Desulfosporosinus acididurans]KLU66986.1 hypothetical protein DEAC_c09200 [Desulfosporosinus acididurans]